VPPPDYRQAARQRGASCRGPIPKRIASGFAVIHQLAARAALAGACG